MAKYETRREVVLAYFARTPVSEIARDLGVSKTRVYQIIAHEEFWNRYRKDHPDDAVVYLKERYDEDYPKLAVSAVNALRRSQYMYLDPDNTIGHLFAIVMSLSDDELLRVRNMGIGKVRFLRMAVENYYNEVRVDDWNGSKAKDDRKKKVFKLVHISGLQKVWRKRSRDRHRGVGRRNASVSRAKTSAIL